MTLTLCVCVCVRACVRACGCACGCVRSFSAADSHSAVISLFSIFFQPSVFSYSSSLILTLRRYGRTRYAEYLRKKPEVTALLESV